MSRTLINSNINWLGKIPNDWTVAKVKNKFFHHKNIAKEESINFDRVSLTLNGVILRDKEDANGLQPEDFYGYQIVNKEDIIFKLIDLENVNTSRVGRSNFEGITSPAYILLHEKEETNRYYDYYFKNLYYQEVFNNLGGNGVRSAINKDDLLNIPLLIPTENESKKIVDYLDDKCEKIDNIIKDNNKEIELLNEYKSQMLSDLLLKYQPKEMKIKYILEKSKVGIKTGPFGSSLTGKTLDNSEYCIYSQANLISNDFTSTKNYISEDTYKELISYEVKSGDILLSMMGTIGKCKIIPNNIKPGIMDSHIIKVRLDKDIILPEYFEAIYDKDNSSIIYDQLLFNSKGSIMDGLNTSIVKDLRFPIISTENQKRFLDDYDKKIKKINEVMKYRQKIISKLEEYKKSLIYEVITGKIEV